ncbi:MAG: proline--tRNA ligase [Acidilobus sp.]
MPGPTRERWQKNFSEWFDWVLERAEVYDYGRYPVKGMGVWMPYGFQIRRRVIDTIRELLDSAGHEEVLFPMLIPEWMLAKEGEHIKGFEDEVYWVTHGGLEPLDVKLALRPTSETPITYYESLWIQSYKQLPRRFYQVVSVFRYETKATRPMIRLREVTSFKEAHTVHESFEDAEKQVLTAINIYKTFFDSLGIPYLISKRPDWDKFAGALYTIAFDTIMPDGRTLQIGTVHNLGQNFTKAFNFRVQLRDESFDYPWQTSYGVSDRVVATLIAVHGDDIGLVLPTRVAPYHVVIVPIPPSDESKLSSVADYARKVYEMVKSIGLRVVLDDRSELTPGEKYYYWDAKGVPLRIEIGLREVSNNTVTVVKRIDLSKRQLRLEELRDELPKLLAGLDKELFERAWSYLRQRISRHEKIEEAKEALDSRGGVVELPWCGSEECALKAAERLEAKVLGTPWPHEEGKGVCPICGRPAVTYLRFARQY